VGSALSKSRHPRVAARLKNFECGTLLTTVWSVATLRSCPLRPDCDRVDAPQHLVAMVESRMGAVAWAIRRRSVSHPRSSNRTCPIKASGSPTGFTERHTGSEPTARGICTVSNSPSSRDTATSDSSGLRWCCQAHRQSPRPPHLRKHARSQGPSLRRHYPASAVLRPCPTPA